MDYEVENAWTPLLPSETPTCTWPARYFVLPHLQLSTVTKFLCEKKKLPFPLSLPLFVSDSRVFFQVT